VDLYKNNNDVKSFTSHLNIVIKTSFITSHRLQCPTHSVHSKLSNKTLAYFPDAHWRRYRHDAICYCFYSI